MVHGYCSVGLSSCAWMLRIHRGTNFRIIQHFLLILVIVQQGFVGLVI